MRINYSPSFKCVVMDKSVEENLTVDEAKKFAPVVGEMKKYKSHDFILTSSEKGVVDVRLERADTLRAYFDTDMFHLSTDEMHTIVALDAYQAAYNDNHGIQTEYLTDDFFVDMDSTRKMLKQLRYDIATFNEFNDYESKDRN